MKKEQTRVTAGGERIFHDLRSKKANPGKKEKEAGGGWRLNQPKNKKKKKKSEQRPQGTSLKAREKRKKRVKRMCVGSTSKKMGGQHQVDMKQEDPGRML